METDRWCALLSDAREMCRGDGCHWNGASLLSGGWWALTDHSLGGCELLRTVTPTFTVESRSGRSGPGTGETQALRGWSGWASSVTPEGHPLRNPEQVTATVTSVSPSVKEVPGAQAQSWALSKFVLL